MVLTVDFNGSGSSGGDSETIVDYTWDFGDATSGNGVTTSHTYVAAGDYYVSLTVTNACGGSDVNTQCVRVTPAIPTPTPTATPTPTVTPTPTATPTPIPEYGNLSGDIRDKETTDLLSGILIDIAGKQTTTNGYGYYRITDILTGTHKLTISSMGYITQAPTVEISVGENNYNTSLDRAPEAYGDIKGRVLDRFGEAIKGAIAKVEDTRQYDDTDSLGYYVITSVPVGTHVITITAAGYETERTEIYISEGLNNIGDTTVYPGVMPIPTVILCLVPRIHTGDMTPRVSTGDPIPRIKCLIAQI